MDGIEALELLFQGPGGRAYLGEAVSLATHMLQAGWLAERSGAADAVVAAALLHDVGHLVAATDADADARHEVTGAEWLAQWFPPGVTEPVRLHVAAKRYLCAMEPGYSGRLSPASVHTLALQGGPMSPDEVNEFQQLAHADAALAVRRWDEAAKNPNAPTPTFDHFRPLLGRLSAV
jgi:gamma-butyrobetaine dioxygenase